MGVCFSYCVLDEFFSVFTVKVAVDRHIVLIIHIYCYVGKTSTMSKWGIANGSNATGYNYVNQIIAIIKSPSINDYNVVTNFKRSIFFS